MGIDSRTLYQRVVRSHDNGWIHAHEEIYVPGETRAELGKVAVAAVNALGLDFAAVDVLARFSNKNPNKLKALVVCEVNTAPGLENTATIEAWTKALGEVRHG